MEHLASSPAAPSAANIYTHLKSEMMKKSSVDMEDVFRRKQEAKGVLAK